MPRVHTSGIELEYETSGSGEPLVLIMGLGGQLTDWHPALVERLSEHFSVIRFDNRDSGLSTTIDSSVPTRWQLLKGGIRSAWAEPAYTLRDLADDTAGLLDGLGVRSAHIVGMSMGGMIAQLMAIHHPERVRSLCSVMSNTGDRRNGRPTASVLRSLARRGEPSRDEIVDITVELFRMVGGADWDEAEQRRRTTRSVARAYNPAGVLRQSMAIAAAADRTDALSTVAAPTVVLHGLDDVLVRSSGGVATAKAIPGARLLLFPDMGHDLPATRHGEIVGAIRRNAVRSQQRAEL